MVCHDYCVRFCVEAFGFVFFRVMSKGGGYLSQCSFCLCLFFSHAELRVLTEEHNYYIFISVFVFARVIAVGAVLKNMEKKKKSAGEPQQDRCRPRPAESLPRSPVRHRGQEVYTKEKHPQVSHAPFYFFRILLRCFPMRFCFFIPKKVSGERLFSCIVQVSESASDRAYAVFDQYPPLSVCFFCFFSCCDRFLV